MAPLTHTKMASKKSLTAKKMMTPMKKKAAPTSPKTPACSTFALGSKRMKVASVTPTCVFLKSLGINEMFSRNSEGCGSKRVFIKAALLRNADLDEFAACFHLEPEDKQVQYGGLPESSLDSMIYYSDKKLDGIPFGQNLKLKYHLNGKEQKNP